MAVLVSDDREAIPPSIAASGPTRTASRAANAVLFRLRARRWPLLFGGLSATCAVLLGSFALPVRYQADCQIALCRAEIRLFLAPVLGGDAVENLELPLPREATATGGSWLGRFGPPVGLELAVAARPPDADELIVKITARSRDPKEAHRLVAERRDRCLARLQADLERAVSTPLATAEAELQATRLEIHWVEIALLELQTGHPAIDAADLCRLSEELAAIRQRREEAAARRDWLARLCTTLEDKLKRAASTPATRSAVGHPPPTESSATDRPPSDEELRLEDEIRATKQEIERARAVLRMTDRHPRVLALSQNLAALERLLADARARRQPGPSPKRDKADESDGSPGAGTPSVGSPSRVDPLRVELSGHRAQLDAVKAEIAELDRQVADRQRAYNERWASAAALQSCTEERAALRERLDEQEAWVRWLRQAAQLPVLSRAVRILGPRKAGPLPAVWPAFRPTLAFSGLVAVFVVLVTGLVPSRSGRVLRSTDDVRRLLGVTAVLSVARIETAGRRRWRLAREVVLGPTLAVGLAGIATLAGTLLFLRETEPTIYASCINQPTAVVRYYVYGDGSPPGRAGAADASPDQR